MNVQKINQILADTAYVRMGGSADELKCAEYLKERCAKLGGAAVIEPFEVDMATIQKAQLTVDGKEITCKGYFGERCGWIYHLRRTRRL